MPFSLDAENPETGLKLDPPSSAPGPDGLLLTRERMGLVRDALDTLGDPCREIIELKYFGGFELRGDSRRIADEPKDGEFAIEQVPG